MPNYKYQKGANFERQVIKDALADGALCAIKGGGSKSYGCIKTDLWVLWPGDGYCGKLQLVQCKRSKTKYGTEKRKFMAVKLPLVLKLERVFINK